MTVFSVVAAWVKLSVFDRIPHTEVESFLKSLKRDVIELEIQTDRQAESESGDSVGTWEFQGREVVIKGALDAILQAHSKIKSFCEDNCLNEEYDISINEDKAFIGKHSEVFSTEEQVTDKGGMTDDAHCNSSVTKQTTVIKDQNLDDELISNTEMSNADQQPVRRSHRDRKPTAKMTQMKTMKAVFNQKHVSTETEIEIKQEPVDGYFTEVSHHSKRDSTKKYAKRGRPPKNKTVSEGANTVEDPKVSSEKENSSVEAPEVKKRRASKVKFHVSENSENVLFTGLHQDGYNEKSDTEFTPEMFELHDTNLDQTSTTIAPTGREPCVDTVVADVDAFRASDETCFEFQPFNEYVSISEEPNLHSLEGESENSFLDSSASNCCPICDFTAKSKRTLKIHMERIHGEKKHTCPTCDVKFATQNDLKKHILNKHSGKNTCSVCGKEYSSAWLLRQHSVIHKDGYRRVKCDECDKTFMHEFSLRIHKDTMHSGKPQRQFLCNFCGKCFSSSAAVQEHENKHRGVCPFSCKECGKSFPYSSSLREHMRSHSDIRGYTCEICKKMFRHRSSLAVHQAVHNTSTRFTCDSCDKKFTQSGALKRHIRLHTGEKPFQCAVCVDIFSDSSVLRRHLIMKHKIKQPGRLISLLKGDTHNLTEEETQKVQEARKMYPGHSTGRRVGRPAKVLHSSSPVVYATGEDPENATMTEVKFTVDKGGVISGGEQTIILSTEEVSGASTNLQDVVQQVLQFTKSTVEIPTVTEVPSVVSDQLYSQTLSGEIVQAHQFADLDESSKAGENAPVRVVKEEVVSKPSGEDVQVVYFIYTQDEEAVDRNLIDVKPEPVT